MGPGVWEKSKSIWLTTHSGEQCAGPWVEPGQSYYDDTPYDGTAFGSVWIEGIYDGPSSAAANSQGCLNLYTEPAGGGDHAKWRFTRMGKTETLHIRRCGNLPR